jgi:hypothetical protein
MQVTSFPKTFSSLFHQEIPCFTHVQEICSCCSFFINTSPLDVLHIPHLLSWVEQYPNEMMCILYAPDSSAPFDLNFDPEQFHHMENVLSKWKEDDGFVLSHSRSSSSSIQLLCLRNSMLKKWLEEYELTLVQKGAKTTESTDTTIPLLPGLTRFPLLKVSPKHCTCQPYDHCSLTLSPPSYPLSYPFSYPLAFPKIPTKDDKTLYVFNLNTMNPSCLIWTTQENRKQDKPKNIIYLHLVSSNAKDLQAKCLLVLQKRKLIHSDTHLQVIPMKSREKKKQGLKNINDTQKLDTRVISHSRELG